jgi:2-iminobutanoate/2-iminopropanoate deaminase
MAKIEKYGAVGFLAGQVAYDKDGSVKHRGDFKAQARDVFAAVRKLVEAGGGTLDNVLKIYTYVTDVRYRPEFRAVREEFFGRGRGDRGRLSDAVTAKRGAVTSW